MPLAPKLFGEPGTLEVRSERIGVALSSSRIPLKVAKSLQVMTGTRLQGRIAQNRVPDIVNVSVSIRVPPVL